MIFFYDYKYHEKDNLSCKNREMSCEKSRFVMVLGNLIHICCKVRWLMVLYAVYLILLCRCLSFGYQFGLILHFINLFLIPAQFWRLATCLFEAEHFELLRQSNHILDLIDLLDSIDSNLLKWWLLMRSPLMTLIIVGFRISVRKM